MYQKQLKVQVTKEYSDYLHTRDTRLLVNKGLDCVILIVWDNVNRVT